MTLLLAGTRPAWTGAGVSFVNNYKFRGLADEHVAPSIALDVINAQHLKREMLEDAGVTVNLTIKVALGCWSE